MSYLLVLFPLKRSGEILNTQVISPAQANIELSLWNAEAEAMSSSDFYLWLSESGLPSEFAIRLKALADETIKVVDRVISIGKIILMKIIEFVKAHPNLAIGVAIGAAIGFLVSMVPFLGPILAPIVAAAGIVIGAIAGNGLDMKAAGIAITNQGETVAIGQNIIEIVQIFFALMADIFNIVFNQ